MNATLYIKPEVIMKNYTIVIEGHYDGKPERHEISRKCESIADLISYIHNGGFKVSREVGQTNKGKLKFKQTPLETNSEWMIADAFCPGIKFQEAVGMKI